MKKKVIISIFILLSLTGIFIHHTFKNNNSNSINEENSENQENTKVEFNEQGKHIVDLVYNKLNFLDYFDQDNLEYVVIKSIWIVGYFESSRNMVHLQINYDYQCKDGTKNNCNNIDFHDEVHDEIIHSIRVIIDLNDSNYIKRISGLSTTMYSDYVSLCEDINNITDLYDIYDIKK